MIRHLPDAIIFINIQYILLLTIKIIVSIEFTCKLVTPEGQFHKHSLLLRGKL